MTPNQHSKDVIDVAIAGAGPYGLSIAAHLSVLGVPFRIFGTPMGAWASQMPKGMHLKSEGFASNLYDPQGRFTLEAYCRQNGIPYARSGMPVALDVFIRYGMAFQKEFAPHLEDTHVTALRRAGSAYELDLEDGNTVHARAVVVATGISQFAFIPPEVASLGRPHVTHSSEHSHLDGFKGRSVAVLGGGASAADLAALLHQSGARVQLLARRAAITFHDPPRARSLKQKILRPSTGIGPGLKLAFYVHAPHLFRRLPESVRLRKVRETLGPAPGWFIKDAVVGVVPIDVSVRIRDARVEQDKVVLRWSHAEGARQAEFDHIIAATGYRIDVHRLPFLDSELLRHLRTSGDAPALTPAFESSLPNLYFVGAIAANSFGPVMRFAFGARFAAQRVARQLHRSAICGSYTATVARPLGSASVAAGGGIDQ